MSPTQCQFGHRGVHVGELRLAAEVSLGPPATTTVATHPLCPGPGWAAAASLAMEVPLLPIQVLAKASR